VERHPDGRGKIRRQPAQDTEQSLDASSGASEHEEVPDELLCLDDHGIRHDPLRGKGCATRAGGRFDAAFPDAASNLPCKKRPADGRNYRSGSRGRLTTETASSPRETRSP
jgi:hypothetical protein